jgi:putative PIN family toxin of toxin-antitoxin system
MIHSERVVFDCNVLVQALISPLGPASACLSVAKQGEVDLFVSQYLIDEVRRVSGRDRLSLRFKLTPERVEKFVEKVLEIAQMVDHVSHVFDYQRDPSDAHYVDLAVACQAKLIVSRDRDLLALEDPAIPEGQSFKRRFPELEILLPEQLLERLRRG